MEDLLGGAGVWEAQTASTTAMACLTGGTLSFTTCCGEHLLETHLQPCPMDWVVGHGCNHRDLKLCQTIVRLALQKETPSSACISRGQSRTPACR